MMRYIFLIISLLPITVQGQGYSIDISLDNSIDTVAYLGHHFATNRYVDDTATVRDGKLVFEGSNSLMEGMYFYYSGSSYFEFLLADQSMGIEADANNIPETIKFSNSPVNTGFFEMQNYTTAKRAESMELQQALASATDAQEKQRLEQKLKDLNKDVLDYQIEVQKKYPNTLLDKLIRLMQKPEIPEKPGDEDNQLYEYLYYKNHFWDGIDIADPGLIRTPLLDPKINDYLDNVVVQHPDSVINEVDMLLGAAGANPEVFRYLLITFANKYETSPIMGFDKVFVHIVEEYYMKQKPDWVDEATLQKLSDRIASIKPNFIGSPAPPLTLWDTIGSPVNLQDIEARFTVLYFYDPDCGHCKTKTPLLHADYPDLQQLGVEILAICTTTDQNRWLEFIKENDLQWINLADLQAQTYFRFYYDIRSTPTVYILDKDKNILVKKIDAEQVLPIIEDLISRGD